jgi:hypothetical protein
MRVDRRIADEDVDAAPRLAGLGDQALELRLASPPFSRIAAATASQGPRFRADITTRPPASANASAIARPMPRLDPVTIATFPDKSNSCMIPSDH